MMHYNYNICFHFQRNLLDNICYYYNRLYIFHCIGTLCRNLLIAYSKTLYSI